MRVFVEFVWQVEKCFMQKFSPIYVYLEIGKLKKVLLHYPGREFKNLVLKFLNKFLFDNISYLEVTQQEHRVFAQTLGNTGVEVVYIKNLLQESVSVDINVKSQFFNDSLKEAQYTCEYLIQVLKDFF